MLGRGGKVTVGTVGMVGMLGSGGSVGFGSDGCVVARLTVMLENARAMKKAKIKLLREAITDTRDTINTCDHQKYTRDGISMFIFSSAIIRKDVMGSLQVLMMVRRLEYDLARRDI
ncbi:hypothetical protein POTOM_053534 [Populus tomentosa]|uniref:Uncharacterized protein n=1 Tax=Populus tomentosa TaxID=118781 RepID=A0A8X7XXK7_POPTO|nr:hypothetical protein POTOM_053534 [Populus tomentosa]